MPDPKDQLLRVSYTFRRLHDEHGQHEARIDELERRAALTQAEEIEEKSLKKRKLYLKDRMAQLARDYHETGAVPDESAAEGAPREAAAPSARSQGAA